jgi:hypothetical protein
MKSATENSSIGGLPVVDSIPDFIYSITPVPETLAQAQGFATAYKAEITDMKLQLEHEPVENSHWFNGNLQARNQWRYRVHQKLRVKHAQLKLIRLWMAENRPAPKDPKELALADEWQKLNEQRAFLESRSKNLERMQGFTAKEFRSFCGEVKFLRSSIAEIADQINLALNEQPIDRERLSALADALSERDRDLKTIQQQIGK